MYKVMATGCLWMMLVFTGCSNIASPEAAPTPQTDPGPQQEQKAGMLAASPVDLFAGDARKFEPFLGAQSGGVKLLYEGKRTELEISLEIWENGVLSKTVNAFSTPLKQDASGNRKLDGELIVSVKDATAEGNDRPAEYVITYGLIDESGWGSSSIRVPKENAYTAQVTLSLQEPIQVQDNQSLAVWGIQATDEHALSSNGNIEETARKAKWALLVRVSVLDPKG